MYACRHMYSSIPSFALSQMSIYAFVQVADIRDRGIETDRQVDRQTERQTERQRQTERETETDRQTNRYRQTKTKRGAGAAIIQPCNISLFSKVPFVLHTMENNYLS